MPSKINEHFNFRPAHKLLPLPRLIDNDDVAKHEKFVLVLITGGTLCMKRNEKGNYAPVEGFLEEKIPDISLLHDHEYYEEHIQDRLVSTLLYPRPFDRFRHFPTLPIVCLCLRRQ